MQTTQTVKQTRYKNIKFLIGGTGLCSLCFGWICWCYIQHQSEWGSGWSWGTTWTTYNPRQFDPKDVHSSMFLRYVGRTARFYTFPTRLQLPSVLNCPWNLKSELSNPVTEDLRFKFLFVLLCVCCNWLFSFVLFKIIFTFVRDCMCLICCY